MKLLLINTLYPPTIVGGAERSVQLLAESLLQLGQDVVVASLHSSSRTSIDWVNGVKVYRVGLRNLYWPFTASLPWPGVRPFWHLVDSYNPLMEHAIGHVLAQERPDLVHTGNLSGFSVSAWKAITSHGNCPIVHTVRDYYLMCFRSTMYKNGRNCGQQCARCGFYSFSRKHASRWVDSVVGISNFVLESHVRRGYFANSQTKGVIHNPVFSDNDFKDAKNKRRRPGKIVFGYMGRLESPKGIELALQAFGRCRNAKWTFLIAGRGMHDYETALHSHYADSRIRFLGHMRPEELLGKVDVLIVPSLWQEPFGRTIIEAYAHGVPVIASRRGGIPEIVEDTTGLLFDPDKGTDELCSRIEKIATEMDIDEMSKSAIAFARRFAPSRIASEYLEVYRTVLQAQTSGRKQRQSSP
jgi:glycosyltransferase involved in cell wall biosynthesis